MTKYKSQLLEILYSSGPAAAVIKSAKENQDRGQSSNLRFPFLAFVDQT
jgi:hypothetical protein